MNKYDRQIRLWSEAGQGSLKSARHLVLGVTAATTEFVKNMVLAGIGHVTIVDGNSVTEADRSASFFMHHDVDGSNRAQVIAQYIQSLNDEAEVVGAAENPNHYIQTPELLASYDIIITTRLADDILMQLWKNVCKTSVLIQIDSYGCVGQVRSFFLWHTIVDSHPESRVELYLHNLWSEIESYSDSIDLEALENHDHEHIAFVVLLIKALQEWKRRHHNGPPSTLPEKKEFKAIIKAFERTYDQENVSEAVRNAWRVSVPKVPEGLSKLFEIQEGCNLREFGLQLTFFSLVRALKQFVAKYDRLPLSGDLPDMKSDTAGYNRIVEIYRTKAKQDAEQFARVYLNLCQLEGLEPASQSEIEHFCKNCRHIRALRGVPPNEDKRLNLRVHEDSEFKSIFSAICGANEYLYRNHLTTWYGDQSAAEALRDYSAHYADQVGLVYDSSAEELHSVSAFLGGIAAQEATKFTLHQYTPFMHTLVYDAIKQATHVFLNGEIFN
ncbi:NEDD8-activating enzyme E1 regulatory subunit [Wickerhamiella sorbophila]|uniref:NEDD8-activating enzyme E1 regulatory subunit n=1 Tax=Wickerhamiella sorbophila TaxID=45607 RepID=A0A2T0FIV0_9ASCO|nr:NEDD8-activating enzyme E1 regulatory subunit [Wickerhamiella sorbophila]PRT54918.1 NEDD8-activating enzyme E1 regulatory subunit [Wickerhamiella sorbophila]